MSDASPWIIASADLLPPSGRALDVACGSGRNALWLAATGLEVTAIDRDAAAIADVRSAARSLGLAVDARVLDLEAGPVDLGDSGYDLIVVVHYLHRSLFPALLRALAPEGLLLYETFTREQARHGRPRNPEFLLDTGELRQLVAPLQLLREREGFFEGRHLASVAARRPRGR